MNISEEKRTQICAVLAKAQQEQAAGVMDISEVERVYRFSSGGRSAPGLAASG